MFINTSQSNVNIYKVTDKNLDNYYNIPLALFSSISNNGGTSAILEYVALETFKRKNNDSPYASWDSLKNYTFAPSENNWKKTINKLEKLGLVVRKGDKVISKKKLTQWKEIQTDDFINKLSGTLRIDLYELYTLRNNKKEYLQDYIYMGLINSIVRGRNYSRKWIEKTTGFKKHQQMKIEERNYLIINNSKKLSPMDHKDLEKEEYKDIIKFPAKLNYKNKTISKSKAKFSNCIATQQGNSYNVKYDYIFSFKSKKEEEFSPFYKVLNSDVEVKGSEDYDAVFSDGQHSNKRSQLFFNSKIYNEFADKKLTKILDFSNTAFIDEKGDLKSIGNVITTC